MTKSFKIFIIVVLALVLQLYFLMLWNTWMHGPVLNLSYRHQERVAAVYDYHLHPSPVTKATLDAELVQMHRYLDMRMTVTLSILVAIDGIGCYYLWKYGHKKTLA